MFFFFLNNSCCWLETANAWLVWVCVCICDVYNLSKVVSITFKFRHFYFFLSFFELSTTIFIKWNNGVRNGVIECGIWCWRRMVSNVVPLTSRRILKISTWCDFSSELFVCLSYEIIGFALSWFDGVRLDVVVVFFFFFRMNYLLPRFDANCCFILSFQLNCIEI